MEGILQHIHSAEWDKAAQQAAKLGITDTDFLPKLEHLASKHPKQNPARFRQILNKITIDNQWKLNAAIQTASSANSPRLALAAVDVGLRAADELAAKLPQLDRFINPQQQQHDGDDKKEEEVKKNESLKQIIKHDQDARKVVLVRHRLLHIRDKVNTWNQIWGSGKPLSSNDGHEVDEDDSEDDSEEEEDGPDGEGEDEDAWGIEAEGEGTKKTSTKDKAKSPAQMRKHPSTQSTTSQPDPTRPTLSHFLQTAFLTLALTLASTSTLQPLQILCERHSTQLWQHRFTIINAIPEWAEPGEYVELLPRVDAAIGKEEAKQAWVKGDKAGWRANEDPDWVEVQLAPLSPSSSSSRSKKSSSFPASAGKERPLSSLALAKYYVDRTHRIASLGLVSTALSFVQHCGSRGVSGLDELGEELSLLSKLVYDRPESPLKRGGSSREEDDGQVTLDQWRELEPRQVVELYLKNSTPKTIAADIRRLVLPYLSVLESRLERAGTPDPTLPKRMLYDHLLSVIAAPVHATVQRQNGFLLLVEVFEQSKPTLNKARRIVKDDLDLARLALALVYGADRTDTESLVAMGRIFECLPALESASVSSSDPSTSTAKANGQGERKSIFSLFPATPSTPNPQHTPSTLFESLTLFTSQELSLALDALDLHLTTAETFSRYSVPCPLNFFLKSHGDAKIQRAWAVRMARTSASGGDAPGPAGRWGGDNKRREGEFEGEDEWVALMEDMVSLTESPEGAAEESKRVFWKLGRGEVLKVFFAGVLGAGRFSLAHSLLNPSSGARPLEPNVEEELVIAASREFYDNAEEGNLNKGEMKLAYECLGAAPPSALIKKEREFIEATSKLCSYNLHSHPGIPLTPIEIRLSKNRLDLIALLLNSNEDVYRHPDVVLDLVGKLGFRGDLVAEVKTLALISGSALSAGDFSRAADSCDKMVESVERLRKVKNPAPPRPVAHSHNHSITTAALNNLGNKPVPTPIEQAAEVAWQNCFQLGKHDDFTDIDRRMKLLGQALVLCPGNKIATLLPVWTRLEDRLAVSRQPRRASAATGGRRASTMGRSDSVSTSAWSASGSHHIQGRASPALTADSVSAAPASRSFGRAAASFFGGVTGAGGTIGGGGVHGRASPKVQSAFERSISPRHYDSYESAAGRYGSSSLASSTSSSPALKGNVADLFGGARTDSSEGLRAGISSRLTAGVGWLIGADEVLEERYQRH
ncbi:hypothetical protein T439DRAFT_344898 [Meredithblackwellia eburnea MCA 4105]